MRSSDVRSRRSPLTYTPPRALTLLTSPSSTSRRREHGPRRHTPPAKLRALAAGPLVVFSWAAGSRAQVTMASTLTFRRVSLTVWLAVGVLQQSIVVFRCGGNTWGTTTLRQPLLRDSHLHWHIKSLALGRPDHT
ncbi:hypothetical protein J6590_086346 [Homalodisca vitripennis]|nr:hypothetical protein J6590_086346 [Homalodisca vitripennis]